MNDNMRKFVRGLMVSTVSKGVMPASKEPVAYLYNGVRLPKLPEWDRETYPYATLSVLLGNYFCAYRIRPYFMGSGISVEQTSAYKEAVLIDGLWDTLEDGTMNADVVNMLPVFWTNFDLLNEDGSVYLAASEPVPVY